METRRRLLGDYAARATTNCHAQGADSRRPPARAWSGNGLRRGNLISPTVAAWPDGRTRRRRGGAVNERTVAEDRPLALPRGGGRSWVSQ
jgi:hypothetical protein